MGDEEHGTSGSARKPYSPPEFEEPGRPQTKPIKHTGAREDTIVRSVRNGATREVAALAAGISKTTLYEWLKDFPEFSDRIREADAAGELDTIEKLNGFLDEDFRAVKYKLDKQYGWERKPEPPKVDEDQAESMAAGVDIGGRVSVIVVKPGSTLKDMREHIPVDMRPGDDSKPEDPGDVADPES